MRRRWKRRLLWAAVLLGVLLLAIPATVVQAMAALRQQKSRTMRRLIPIVALVALGIAVGSSNLAAS